jgi:ribosome-binding protein aMBF1 (putative translation factor)
LAAFISSRIGQTIAAQVRVLRQREQMSQADLAKCLGTSQNAIYRLENPRYIKHNTSTLKRVAEFFKVGLIVRFAPLSEIVDWTNNLSETSINVPDLTHDTGFVDFEEPESVEADRIARLLTVNDVNAASGAANAPTSQQRSESLGDPVSTSQDPHRMNVQRSLTNYGASQAPERRGVLANG